MKRFLALLPLLLLLLLPAQAPAAESDEELAKKSLNPVASLISVPFEGNLDHELGPGEDKTNFLLNVQPVIPFSVSEKYNLITRTIVPVKANEFPDSVGGLGDVTPSFFLSPKDKVGGWIVGAGPVLLLPTATDETLGSEKWGAGPSAVVLRQDRGFTYGLLANHVWSFAGESDREDVNVTFLQPFLGYTTKTYTTFMVNTESTYDWDGEQWTVPVNVYLTQMLKIAGQPLSLKAGYRYYADAPEYGPSWGLRFGVSLLFPK